MDKLLPIGSVVSIKNQEEPLVVLGFYPEAEGRSYDYLAAIFPQGILEVPALACFNYEHIDRVLFVGYQDELGSQVLDAAQVYCDTVATMNQEIARAAVELYVSHPEWSNESSTEVAGSDNVDALGDYSLE